LHGHLEARSVAILDDEVPQIANALVIARDPSLGLYCSKAQAQVINWLNDTNSRTTAPGADAEQQESSRDLRHASEGDDGAGLLDLAIEPFERKSDAIRWVRSPHELLQGETPQQYASILAGVERARAMLVQLRYGDVCDASFHNAGLTL
jgi:hypothetical protein